MADNKYRRPGATPKAAPAPIPAPAPNVPDTGGLAGTGSSGNHAVASLTAAQKGDRDG
jgi:hypothetical protein